MDFLKDETTCYILGFIWADGYADRQRILFNVLEH